MNTKKITTNHMNLDGNMFQSVLTVELVDNAIIMIERDGESLQNKHGGYSCLHTGSPAYLTKKFNQLGV